MRARSLVQRCVLVALAASSALTFTALEAAELQDPFDGEVWHAIDSWPGVLRFDKRTHAVSLEPLGAEPIRARYRYTIEPGPRKAVTGTLTLTTEKGESSKARFTLAGKDLELTFDNSPRAEKYRRMSETEEEQERERLRKRLTPDQRQAIERALRQLAPANPAAVRIDALP